MTAQLDDEATEADRLAAELLAMIPASWRGKAEPPYGPERSVFAYVADRQAIQWARVHGNVCSLRAFGRFIGSVGLSCVADAIGALADDGCPSPEKALTAAQAAAVEELEALVIAGGRFRSEFVDEKRSLMVRFAVRYPEDVPAILDAFARGNVDAAEIEHAIRQMRRAPAALRDGAL